MLTHARLSLCCVPQVERELAAYTDAGTLRASVLRPSLVYTPRRPAALPAVGAFWVANSLGIPFIDRPVTVDTLAAAAVRALTDADVQGVQGWREMEALAARRD